MRAAVNVAVIINSGKTGAGQTFYRRFGLTMISASRTCGNR